MASAKKICVIGSLNMDLVATVDHFPRPGETVTGRDFGTFPGGKGANQAVAAGRLGGTEVRMVGRVGDDMYGGQYMKVLKDAGVATRGVGMELGVSTGIAVISVDGRGENNIVIIPGANGTVDRDFIDSKASVADECDIFLFQLEIPLDTVEYAMKRMKEKGKIVILDPAPARALPDEFLQIPDYVTPNETELAILSGVKADSEEATKNAAQVLLGKGVRTLICKAGKNGAYIATKGMFTHVPGFKVDVVDTTAAGDAFNAALALGLARGDALVECVRLANAAGALATTAKGAQAAMPTLKQVEALIKSGHGNGGDSIIKDK
jgi:ribokinase